MAIYLNDISIALEILEQYKDQFLELPEEPAADSDRYYMIRKREAIDELGRYIENRAFEAPVLTLIEDFIYSKNKYLSLYPRDSEAYEFLCIMKETAEEVLYKFM